MGNLYDALVPCSGVANILEWINSLENELVIADNEGDAGTYLSLTKQMLYAEKLLKLEEYHNYG